MTHTQRCRLILNVPLAAALLADSWRATDERRDPEGDDTELPYKEGGEKQEKYLLKLCFSPDAE